MREKELFQKSHPLQKNHHHQNTHLSSAGGEQYSNIKDDDDDGINAKDDNPTHDDDEHDGDGHDDVGDNGDVDDADGDDVLNQCYTHAADTGNDYDDVDAIRMIAITVVPAPILRWICSCN